MAAPWSRLLTTTINKYFHMEEINILRNRRLLALLQSEGRIEYNLSGNQMEWPVKYRRLTPVGYADMDVVAHARQDQWKRAVLDWRGYIATDAVSKFERLMNKGDEALVKIFGAAGERIKESLEDYFGEQLYQDGRTAGNKGIHGIESFLSDGGSTGVAAGFRNGASTFAGLSNALGGLGGSWGATSWPYGTGDISQSYDAWTPILVDYTHATAWGGAGFTTWAGNANKVLRAGIIAAQRSKARKGQLTTVIAEGSMYRDALNLIAANERILVDRGEKSKLVQLGFNETFMLDGVEIGWEYGIPGNTAYGFNVQMMILRALDSQLFNVEDTDYDVSTLTWRLGVLFAGNCVWNPRHFCKWLNYT